MIEVLVILGIIVILGAGVIHAAGRKKPPITPITEVTQVGYDRVEVAWQVDYDDHTYVVIELRRGGGGIIHHPDCLCTKEN